MTESKVSNLALVSITACLAQSVERQALNLMVVGSSPTVGAFLFFAVTKYLETHKVMAVWSTPIF